MRSDFKEAYINRGDILIKLDRADEALRMYEAALRIDPRDADVHFNIGVLRLEKWVFLLLLSWLLLLSLLLLRCRVIVAAV